MKSLILTCGLVAFAFTASAADLRLNDGRLLRDATVISQTPRTVFIQHAGGLSSVPKTTLPPAVYALYPVDEAAARAAEEQAAQAQARAQAFHQTEAARVARYRAEREAIVAYNDRVNAQEAAEQRAREAEAVRQARERSEIVYEYTRFVQPVCNSHHISRTRDNNDWTRDHNRRHVRNNPRDCERISEPDRGSSWQRQDRDRFSPSHNQADCGHVTTPSTGASFPTASTTAAPTGSVARLPSIVRADLKTPEPAFPPQARGRP